MRGIRGEEDRDVETEPEPSPPAAGSATSSEAPLLVLGNGFAEELGSGAGSGVGEATSLEEVRGVCERAAMARETNEELSGADWAAEGEMGVGWRVWRRRTFV